MQIRTIFIVAIFLAAGLFLNSVLRTRHGSGTAIGGQFTASADYKPYYAKAHTELVALLQKHGFESNAAAVKTFAGLHSETDREEWYDGSYQGSLPFRIIVRVGEGKTSSGMTLMLSTDFDDFTWRVKESDRKAEAFGAIVTEWCSDFQKRHPLENAL